MTSRVPSTLRFDHVVFEAQGQSLLKGVCGEFSGGCIHAIVGQNGAGKTTLLRCLSKELTPQAGQISLQQRALRDWSFAELAQRRAVLSQQQELAFSFSVTQLIELGLEVAGGRFEQRQSRLQVLLELCDLQALAQRNILTLSGGEQKRAQLARVLAQIWPDDWQNDAAFAGKWLFLDEWSDGLDLKHQVQIGCLLKQLAAKGLGVVMILHDLNQVAQWADEVLLLKQGEVMAQGDTQAMLTQANLLTVMDVEVAILPASGSTPLLIFPARHSH
ncbi:ATP-binding cassette domain-containing protein [Thiomicrorhabdus cannonii]|uniref:ATP-binding cassette domain-containing protein n=1 Tax=Thiomicrorhabdus cannonii TaxID=2748011 RepID=UPI0015B89EAB|nr:ATP-binding cassette domain-containing protein [Thiomicrorhabdus cannonii]